MNLSTALATLLIKDYQQYPVCIFTYENEYPVLFFTALLQRLSQSQEIVFKNISSTLEDRTLLETELQTTFLGQTHTLWIGTLSGISQAAEKTKILNILSAYKGPHRLLGCIAAKDVTKSFTSTFFINIDQELSSQDKDVLIRFLYPSLTYASIQKIAGGISSFKTIDSLIILAHYAMVLGKNTDAFVKDWLPKIIVPESSLFALSQYFFSKKTVSFWNAWNVIKHEYPVTFWTVFWSEQFWRAYYVVLMQQHSNIIEARKMAYRLPFSFIQKDWRDTSLQELSSAHTMLYEIEWRIKNGGSEEHFDLLFSRFFLGLND